MTDPWTAPGDPAATEPTPARPVAAARPGTEPTDVVRAVFEDLKANPVGYILSGTAYVVAVLAVVVFAIAVLGLGLAPGIAREDETLLVIGGILGMLVYTGSIFGFSFLLFPVMQASLIRGISRQADGEARIGFTSLLDDRAGAGRIVGFYLAGQVLMLVGMLMLYIPGLIAMALTFFAMPMVVLEGVGIAEAYTIGWRHFQRNVAWHVVVWILMFVAAVVLQLTLVGLLLIFPVIVAFQVFAHRAAFPEGARAWAAANP